MRSAIIFRITNLWFTLALRFQLICRDYELLPDAEGLLLIWCQCGLPSPLVYGMLALIRGIGQHILLQMLIVCFLPILLRPGFPRGGVHDLEEIIKGQIASLLLLQLVILTLYSLVGIPVTSPIVVEFNLLIPGLFSNRLFCYSLSLFCINTLWLYYLLFSSLLFLCSFFLFYGGILWRFFSLSLLCFFLCR